MTGLRSVCGWGCRVAYVCQPPHLPLVGPNSFTQHNLWVKPLAFVLRLCAPTLNLPGANRPPSCSCARTSSSLPLASLQRPLQLQLPLLLPLLLPILLLLPLLLVLLPSTRPTPRKDAKTQRRCSSASDQSSANQEVKQEFKHESIQTVTGDEL